MTEAKPRLKVVLFSGGRGTTSISDALLRYPDIDLTMLINAYDDGLSTGLIRRFIPGLLGPSDVRKVISGLLKHQTDAASTALQQLLEYRLPDPITESDALALLDGLISWQPTDRDSHELLLAKENLSLKQLRQISRFLAAFKEHYYASVKERPWFTFADNSVGNLLFGGGFLVNNQDFNQTIQAFSDLAGVGNRVVNITMGENLVLTALKENGRYLADEAAIVSPQDDSRIEEIFLLPGYLDQKTVDSITGQAEKIAFLRQAETLPQINPAADQLLGQADIIIYGPGTQHSSLYPSYLTTGVAEAIRANKKAEKIFIANIARDHDILSENAASLVRDFTANMSRKNTYPVDSRHLVSRFFFQKPETANSTELDYLPFEAGAFDQPLDRVVWVDLEGDKGKHAGGRTVSELLIVVEEQLRKRIRHVPHKVSIIVPALNEGRTIKRVLQDLKDLQFPEMGLEKEIIVVDGGSADKTFAIASSEPNVRVYQNTSKSGRGAALRLGLEKAKGDIIVFFPSDNEYDAADILRVVSPLVSQEFPAVFGSRAFSQDLSGTLQRIYGGKGARFAISKYGGMLLSIVTLLFYQRYVGDPLTSIKGFNRRALRGLRFTRQGVDFEMELIAKLAKSGYAILEVPVSYKARTVKQGKKITVEDGVSCLFTLLRFSTHKPRHAQS
ncbi:MAG TPA: 2-phospho-L-lactate transferase CofD family protein [Candidatus Saccharimonadales bacterium]|nr:2-phospho-L-lactate transferase CofD family protein [Candidatus Saccharimonadales bacterium]